MYLSNQLLYQVLLWGISLFKKELKGLLHTNLLNLSVQNPSCQGRIDFAKLLQKVNNVIIIICIAKQLRQLHYHTGCIHFHVCSRNHNFLATNPNNCVLAQSSLNIFTLQSPEVINRLSEWPTLSSGVSSRSKPQLDKSPFLGFQTVGSQGLRLITLLLLALLLCSISKSICDN